MVHPILNLLIMYIYIYISLALYVLEGSRQSKHICFGDFCLLLVFPNFFATYFPSPSSFFDKYEDYNKKNRNFLQFHWSLYTFICACVKRPRTWFYFINLKNTTNYYFILNFKNFRKNNSITPPSPSSYLYLAERNWIFTAY